jgi:hypothetical protein
MLFVNIIKIEKAENNSISFRYAKAYHKTGFWQEVFSQIVDDQESCAKTFEMGGVKRWPLASNVGSMSALI